MSEANELDARIRLRDEALLGWYFCEGQSVFERSTFGAILEHQEHFGLSSKPCDRCGGNGFNDEDVTRATEAIGKHAELRRADWPAYQRTVEALGPKCRKCHGCGHVPSGRIPTPRPQRVHCKACRGTRVNMSGAECGVCNGTGLRDGYDATSTADHEESSYTPDDWALQRYAVASRGLTRLNAGNAAVLQAFYGPVGLRCGAGDPRRPDDPVPGRLLAVYPLTGDGRRWLRHLPNPQELPPYELLVTEWILERQQPRRERANHLDACRKQAEALLAKACAAWNWSQRDRKPSGWRDEFAEIALRRSARDAA